MWVILSFLKKCFEIDNIQKKFHISENISITV